MKACFYETYGPPSAIEVRETATPEPAENEVLVKVHCCTVNRTDTGMRSANYIISRLVTGLLKPKVPISGTDFAGVVEKVGIRVTDFEPGDRVFGFDDNQLGSHAQYFCMPIDKPMMHIPDGVDFSTAVASLEGMHYAINIANKTTLTPEDKVMVYGASGAIGSALVQLLESKGIFVTAVCGTETLAQVSTLGADKVVDYKKADFREDDLRYRCVFDAVGKETFGRCKGLLEAKGAYCSTELGPYGQNIWFSLLTPLFGGKKVLFPLPTDIRKSMEQIISMLNDGGFQPLIDTHYALEDIQSAFEYATAGKKVGNVIVDMC